MDPNNNNVNIRTPDAQRIPPVRTPDNPRKNRAEPQAGQGLQGVRRVLFHPGPNELAANLANLTLHRPG